MNERKQLLKLLINFNDDLDHQFQQGTTFNKSLALYEFDRKLRLLVFDANRVLAIKPVKLKSPDETIGWLKDDTLYGGKIAVVIASIVYLLKTIYSQGNFFEQFQRLLKEYNIDPSDMGFPTDWKEDPLWQ